MMGGSLAKIALLMPLAIAIAGPAIGQDFGGHNSSCVACHAQLDGSMLEPTENWATDVHNAPGLGCTGCHGGDPSPDLADDAEASMDPAKGFRAVPSRLTIADFCGRCHSDAAFMKRYNPQARVDQVTEYRTSTHGVANAKGDPVPATCTDCHGAHGILPVSAPESPVFARNVPGTCARCHSEERMMAPYGIPVDVHEKYMRSAHAVTLFELGDVAAPACNDCHGNHGASPPGVESVANVCGQCHGREASLFRRSPKREIFEGLGIGECTACHGQHQVVHPTTEMIHAGAEPTVSRGRFVEGEAFHAQIGNLSAGETAEASWRVVLRPHLAADDPRARHHVEVAWDGGSLRIDASIPPGDRHEASHTERRAAEGALTAVLAIDPILGLPVDEGDPILLKLKLQATAGVAGVQIQHQSGDAVALVKGSVCRTCHSPGDDCDRQTERMYETLNDLDRSLREAANLLHKAEIAGMEVSEPTFALKSKGRTAAVEARALIHAFDPERLIEKAQEGRTEAEAGRSAALAALQEIQSRRKGLAVSLIFIAAVLGLLWAKIRQIDNGRRQAGTAK